MNEVESAGAESYCEIMDMDRHGCAHCRDRGLYKPADGMMTNGLNVRSEPDSTMKLELVDGEVWVAPDKAQQLGVEYVHADEGLRRGKFARGNRHGGYRDSSTPGGTDA